MKQVRGFAGWEEHAEVLLTSYRRLLGKGLLEGEADDGQVSMAELLYKANTVVLSHDTEADPVLNYGNAAALQLWEMDERAFASMPSRLTAEPMLRADRQAFLEQVARDGFIADYTGVRISSTGRRFLIKQATVWNLVDGSGRYLGQAAAFRELEWL